MATREEARQTGTGMSAVHSCKASYSRVLRVLIQSFVLQVRTLDLLYAAVTGSILMVHVMMKSVVNGVTTRDLNHVRVILNSSRLAQLLRANKGQDSNVRQDGDHKDADDLAIVVDLGLTVRRQRILCSGCRLDSSGSAGDEVAELVGGTQEEGGETGRAELEHVRGDDAPAALDPEQLEEGNDHDGLVPHVAVGVEECAGDHAGQDQCEAAAPEGREVAHCDTAGDGS